MDEKLLANGGDQPKGHHTLTNDVEDHRLGMYDKPLPYFGWGIGWFCLLVGFIFPVMWYFATILYFCNYYQRDPRERAGLAASAIAFLVDGIVHNGLQLGLLWQKPEQLKNDHKFHLSVDLFIVGVL